MAYLFFDKANSKNILEELWRQCESEEFCDVVLIAGTEEIRIPVHRNILSATCEYFKKMFTTPLRERYAGEIKLPNVDGETFKLLVKFCYIRRIEITEHNVQKLLETAEFLLLGAVVKACSNFLEKQLHPTNCLGFALLAQRYNCESLLKQATDYSLNNFMDLYDTEEFLNLDSEQLSQLLASDNLNVETEEDVFTSLRAWINHDRTSREKCIDQLLKLVRMPLIEPSFLIDQVRPLCTSTECHKLFVEAMECHSVPARREIYASNSTRRSNPIVMAISTAYSEFNILYYCPKRLKWMKWLKSLEKRRMFGFAVMDDHIYIVGGIDAGGNALNTVECLNLKTMSLEQVNPMTRHREGCGVAVLKGYLYAVGGRNRSNFLSSVEKFDPKTNSWNEVAPMSVSRGAFGIAELNGKLYVVGGDTSNLIPLNSAESYDADENEWKSIAPMSESRDLLGVAVASGMLYAIGGYKTKSVQRYDCVTNKWTTICSLSEELTYSKSCTTFENRVMVFYNDRVEEYDPSTNEWKLNTSIKGLWDCLSFFPYAGDLLKSEFTEIIFE